MGAWLAWAAVWGEPAGPGDTTVVQVSGLFEPVEILQDPWGVCHIYASREEDLFFAQGWNAARDRLFQLELWRRQATGTLAEVLGRKALDRDIGARLLRFRGDLEEELAHYHPRGGVLIRAFVRGINAYLEEANRNPQALPLEFQLLGIRPGPWSPEIVVSRHNGLFRNTSSEVKFARGLQSLGAEKLQRVVSFQPPEPRLEIEEGVDVSLLSDEVLRLYRASRAPVWFHPEDIADPSLRAPERAETAPPSLGSLLWAGLGSNNWAVGPSRSFTGFPFLANDPHRVQQVPSLRYFVHLVGPGWNVIGGGEPALPGVSIGHNGSGAWGLTIFPIDQEDLYVYDTDPSDPDRYRYRNGWERVTREEVEIPVKGKGPEKVTLRFTRHGPVLYQEPVHHKMYALRAAWLEVGTAPYLASLRMNQAQTWGKFREACRYFLAPSENMVWADRQGTIGWQATGIAPRRPNWDGLLPVPGDGRFEWEGFLPVLELPSLANPAAGYLATANQNNLPAGYPHRVGFQWTEPFRFARLQEVLGTGRLLTLRDMVSLQLDELSLPARQLVPLLQPLSISDSALRRVRDLLLGWDFVLRSESSAAAVYALWERQLRQKVCRLEVGEEAAETWCPEYPIGFLIARLTSPDPLFGRDPLAGRDAVLLQGLQEAVEDLRNRFGNNPQRWRYGDERLHHIRIRHPLSAAVREPIRRRLDLDPLPRGGDRYTVNMTNSADLQASGASFRIVVDLQDWDRSLATNTPGQSGNPDSPHYRDLYPLWGRGQYFPLLYSREKIEAVARARWVLQP